MALTGSNRAAAKRRHRRWPWITAGVVVLLLLAGWFTVASAGPQPGPPPLALPAGAAAGQSQALDGTWTVLPSSVAGFRVRETFFGRSNDVVGRTNSVTGSIALTGTQVSSATFRIDLTTIKITGKTQPQFATSLNTQGHPVATFSLSRPITLDPGLATGATVTAAATGQLTLDGVSRPTTWQFTGRRGAAGLQAVGSIPITFSDWGIWPAANYGPIGSLADHGVAEFLLTLQRR
jgi:polyisoprenoid-binding protein YceI